MSRNDTIKPSFEDWDSEQLEHEHEQRPRRPAPGKSNLLHGRRRVCRTPGKVSLTELLDGGIDRFSHPAHPGRSRRPRDSARVRYTRNGSEHRPLPTLVQQTRDTREAPASGNDTDAAAWERVLVRPDLHSAPNPGMPRDIQAKMEHAFQSDFSGVEIHPSSSRATIMGAAAFTRGESIHFAAGSYDPFSHTGQALLGHELAHVVQQRQGRVRAPSRARGRGMAINSDVGLEREADNFGARAARGERVAISGAASARRAPAAAAAQFQWTNDGEGKKDPELDVPFTHANVHEDGRPAFTAYWHPGLGEDHIWVEKEGSPKLTKQGTDSRDPYFKKIRRDFHPWKQYAEENPNIGIGKPRGSGGTRTISGKDAKYSVAGGSPELHHFLAQLDDYAEDPSTTSERLSYGDDVPTLKSTLPIAEDGKPTEGDCPSEALPASLKGKKTVQKSVRGNYIDKELLDAWQGNRKTDGNADQGQVMEELDEVGDGSATQEAKKLGFKESVGGHGWEWLHLVAYSMGGHQGYAQHSENLVLATWHANSAHLTIESAIKSLAWKSSEVILVDVTADYLEGTQVGKIIHYNLSTSEGRKMHFQIDCLGRVRPTSHDEKYWFMIMADQLLSGEEKTRVLEERVKDDKSKKEDKDAVTPSSSEMCPPSPPHYSQLSQAQLEAKHPPEIVVEGEKRKREDLDEKRKKQKGSGKLGAVFSSSNTSDWNSDLPAATPAPATKDLGLDQLSKLFTATVCNQILSDTAASGQYVGNKYTATDGSTWQITTADTSSKKLTFTKRE